MSFRSRRIAELARERMLAAMSVRQSGPDSPPSAMPAPRLDVVVDQDAGGERRVFPAIPMAHSAENAEELAE